MPGQEKPRVGRKARALEMAAKNSRRITDWTGPGVRGGIVTDGGMPTSWEKYVCYESVQYALEWDGCQRNAIEYKPDVKNVSGEVQEERDDYEGAQL